LGKSFRGLALWMAQFAPILGTVLAIFALNEFQDAVSRPLLSYLAGGELLAYFGLF
jgi:hypothetical protein